MIGTEVLGSLGRLTYFTFGLLLTIGTSWFGALCLVNALRCGRSHCWLDGTLLPALAALGVWNLLSPHRFGWDDYLSAFWAILIASVLLECVVGSYLRAGGSRSGPPHSGKSTGKPYLRS